ncbi:MAG: hypothetical protein M3065_05690 [Actinomycetota bacterium]|nr:hypothetical protein [Actinomycetota bacterium]
MDVAQLATAIALALLTAAYVYATFQLVGETRKSQEEAKRGREQSAKDNQLLRDEMAAGREEAREARLQSVRPRLALTLLYRGPTAAFVEVKNVGQGPALDVDVELAFEPMQGSSSPGEVRRWRRNLIDLAEGHWFMPSGADGGFLDIHSFAAAFTQLTLTGTMRDALGEIHQVHERFEDLPGYRDLNRRAWHIWQPDETARALEEIGKPITDGLRELVRAVEHRTARGNVE